MKQKLFSAYRNIGSVMHQEKKMIAVSVEYGCYLFDWARDRFGHILLWGRGWGPSASRYPRTLNPTVCTDDNLPN